MARIKLDLPLEFHFETTLQVRVTDLNYGNHLGNDALLGMIHEARVQFFRSFGYTEGDIAGAGLIMGDLAVVYQAEGFLGDELRFEVTAADFSRSGCDLFYRVTRLGDGKAIAQAKTGIVFFDYAARKIRAVPEEFKARFTPQETSQA